MATDIDMVKKSTAGMWGAQVNLLFPLMVVSEDSEQKYYSFYKIK